MTVAQLGRDEISHRPRRPLEPLFPSGCIDAGHHLSFGSQMQLLSTLPASLARVYIRDRQD